jgi:acetoin utilization protein AcuC
VPRQTALIYSPDLTGFSLGEDHPFKPERYRLAFELMTAYGLTCPPHRIVSGWPLVEEDELLAFHTADYLARFREFSASPHPRADFRYGLGDAENPIFPGVYDCALQGASATAAGASLLLDGRCTRVFHLAGGWHHAHRAKASGFSYLNDGVLAINRLLARGKRVVYLDIDAHHGDGVQEAYYHTDKVLTISLHQSGVYFFPGTGFEREMGSGEGKGYSVNLPFCEHLEDSLFIRAFDEVVAPLLAAFAPDLLVTQLGADAFYRDPLSLLEITTSGYAHVLTALRRLNLPWLAMAGGGYDSFNVARAWTLAWAIMNDAELEPALPESFVRPAYPHAMLWDPPHSVDRADFARAETALDRSISLLQRQLFPLLGARP